MQIFEKVIFNTEKKPVRLVSKEQQKKIVVSVKESKKERKNPSKRKFIIPFLNPSTKSLIKKKQLDEVAKREF